MSTAKGKGVTVYVRASTVATVTAHVLCATSNSGGGVESETIDVEPCLQDETIERVTQDRKYTAITVQVKEQFGTATNVSSVLEALAGSTNQVTYIKKIPTSTPVYKSKIAQIVSYIPDDVERGQDMTATMVLQPQSDWTNSTTAPTTA
jgi:hypothetical protein